jgi:hypothetical protein
MRRMMAFEITLAISAAICLLVPMSATADTTSKRCGKTGKCYVIAKRDRVLPNDKKADSKADHPDADKKRRAREVNLSAALAAYDRSVAAYTRCMQTLSPSSNIAACGTPPTAPRFDSDTFSGRGNQPQITAGQAAAIAVARLQLPRIPPGIGPSPDINPWNMAAVGYPVWFWAGGPTRVGPVSDSVAGLSVSLEAEVSSMTFRMGDGHTVRCAGSGHPWTAAVQPGAKSPSCGYTYAKPSLPDRTYTVAAIANWAVTWTSNGQSGVINVPAVDTTELPVGELQVLVR